MSVAPPSPFAWSFRIRYHETDPQKFAFNGRYLEYADVAMTEFFRNLGWGYPEMLNDGFDPSVVKSTIEYHLPAVLDDLVQMDVRCTALGTSSFTLAFTLRRSGQTLCSIENIYVNVDAPSKRSIPVPQSIAESLRATLPGPDER